MNYYVDWGLIMIHPEWIYSTANKKLSSNFPVSQYSHKTSELLTINRKRRNVLLLNLLSNYSTTQVKFRSSDQLTD
jgi:hypothetical protein